MRASRVRIRKLEQSIETFTANRRALDEMRKPQAERVAAEWERLSDKTRDRYNTHHDAYQAVYQPRFIARALQAMAKDSKWGGLADRMKLIDSVKTEVEQELGLIRGVSVSRTT